MSAHALFCEDRKGQRRGRRGSVFSKQRAGREFARKLADRWLSEGWGNQIVADAEKGNKSWFAIAKDLGLANESDSEAVIRPAVGMVLNAVVVDRTARVAITDRRRRVVLCKVRSSATGREQSRQNMRIIQASRGNALWEAPELSLLAELMGDERYRYDSPQHSRFPDPGKIADELNRRLYEGAAVRNGCSVKSHPFWASTRRATLHQVA